MLQKIEIRNFRLLENICVSLEKRTTVIVGRNNSGKTSLTELFEHLLYETNPHFSLEDFTLSIHEDFWNSFLLKIEGAEENIVREKLPFIEAKLTFLYDKNAPDLGMLSNFIIDLDANSNKVVAKVNYRLDDGKIDSFFDGFTYSPELDQKTQKKKFFKLMKERIKIFYSTFLTAVDPTDDTNEKKMDLSNLKSLIKPGFINAQRRLDDYNNKQSNVLGKVLENILNTAKSEMASPDDKTTAQNLESAIEDIQKQMDTDFNEQLNNLLPMLSMFGYPGLSDSQLHTETILDVERLLTNNTKLNYEGANGIGLPETYNGLGSRNLIYILFQIFDFFKSFQATSVSPDVHIIFIEEPEAHLHPQMQEVFIRKLGEIADHFSQQLIGKIWPVQFIVTTHSSHVANEAPFETIRYFLSTKHPTSQTKIKDLREVFSDPLLESDKDFLQKYLTLTRCDLFFSDKAILIEGPTERLLMPRIISILEKNSLLTNHLSSQYMSCVEVGGAYAHHFFSLLNSLELQTLVITDIDTVKKTTSERIKYEKCKFSESTNTSNACIKNWFNDPGIAPSQLILKDESAKVKDAIRISYQVPENSNGPCGRSFEDAFMLANFNHFDIQGITNEEKEDDAWKKADKKKENKTDFALECAMKETEWIVPRYIEDGLVWLATSTSAESSEVVVSGSQIEGEGV